MKVIYEKYKELILYIIFGVLTTGVNWVIYLLFSSGFHVDMTLSNALAWFGAVLFAFFTNKWFVFQSKSLSVPLMFREMATFFGARIVSGLFEIFLPTLLYSLGLKHTFLGIEGFAAKALVSIIIILLNYVLSKLLVFRKK